MKNILIYGLIHFNEECTIFYNSFYMTDLSITKEDEKDAY